MEEKVQLMTTALLQLEELNATKTEEVIALMEEGNTTRTVVTDSRGLALYDSLTTGNGEGKYLLFPELVTALEGQNVFYGRYEDETIECRLAIPLMRKGRVLGAVYLMEHNSEQGTLIHALQMNILRISLVLEGGIILFSLFFSTAFSKRLRQILASVRNMGEGDYSQHIQLRGTDELSILGREFNDLADRLQASEQTRRQFVSDASHELKTPLATIKLLSDSILQNEMDPETEREFIDDIGREADRLGRLTQKLLALTKLDSTIAEDMEILEGGNTVRKVVRMLRPLAELRRITMDCSCDEGCSLMMVEDDLYQIVFNLAENAIKYNRDGGWVGLELRKKETTVELVVSDAGVGIPEESLPHIFDRFYRVDKARSRAAGGSGLGLSIVHAMVQRNDGSIEVAVRPEGGTVFTVQFPLFDMKEEE